MLAPRSSSLEGECHPLRGAFCIGWDARYFTPWPNRPARLPFTWPLTWNATHFGWGWVKSGVGHFSQAFKPTRCGFQEHVCQTSTGSVSCTGQPSPSTRSRQHHNRERTGRVRDHHWQKQATLLCRTGRLIWGTASKPFISGIDRTMRSGLRTK